MSARLYGIISPKTMLLILTTVRSLYHNIPCYVICSYSSVRTITGYGLDSWGLIPGGSNIFFLLHSIRITLGLTLFSMQWLLFAVSLGVKYLEQEADHLPSTSAEIKNDGIGILALPHMSSCHGAQIEMRITLPLSYIFFVCLCYVLSNLFQYIFIISS
jgi:hypothetical protein